MCGRFVLITDLTKILQAFDVQKVTGELHQGVNISPGQMISAVVRDEFSKLVNFKWGLVPSWAKDPSIGNKMINARAETVAEKPSFRQAFKRHRCLIVADGFYEWKPEGRKKTPLWFGLKSGEPFGFAGLYEIWHSPDKTPLQTCTIITTDANDLISPIHDRMPVIVPKTDEAAWIDPDNQDRAGLLSILKPYPQDLMVMAQAKI
ncbi:MAG: SOS response-associated peptidase [Syntrophaceae bacterium]|nr:SOS response-associated peptidase [Syntrophaceae bacterium]